MFSADKHDAGSQGRLIAFEGMPNKACDAFSVLNNEKMQHIADETHISMCYSNSFEVFGIKFTWRLQVAEQRAAMPEEASADDVAPWMSGDVEEEAAAELRKKEEDLDAETLHLLHTQRQYYDSVHVIKEKACAQLPAVILPVF